MKRSDFISEDGQTYASGRVAMLFKPFSGKCSVKGAGQPALGVMGAAALGAVHAGTQSALADSGAARRSDCRIRRWLQR